MPDRSDRPTEVEEYTSAMRIVGGTLWGSVLSLAVGAGLVLIPQVPRAWLWAIPPLWVLLSALGILLQWSVARGRCPKCGYQLAVPALGRRCPQCNAYLKAVNRKIIRI
ncbi:hypothetical protein [Synechococcus sp. PCC 7336]|uniref:hypothetical protein n=1 Tax=Synechococcus sp. PCC 7336 TaxID=195250 RepID=UPI000349AB33|nr:hypothetical protein [Synechococcus sp. PCC 7336]